MKDIIEDINRWRADGRRVALAAWWTWKARAHATPAQRWP